MIKFLLSCGIIILSSCKTIRQIESFRINPTTEKETIIPLKQSYSTVPISIPLQTFYDKFKKQLYQYIIQNEDYPGYSNVGDGKQAKFVMRIDELYFEHPNEHTLRIRFKINYVLWGRTTDGPGGFWKYVDCADDGDKWLGMSFEISLPYPITSGAYGLARYAGHSFYDTECNLGFDLWGVEGHTKLAGSITCAVEKTINRVLQKTLINTSVEALLKKIKPDNYFNTLPGFSRINAKIDLNNITFGKMQIVAGKLELVVGVNYTAILATEDISPVIPVDAFAKNMILESSDQAMGFNDNVAIVLSYKTITTALDSLIVKKIPDRRVHIKKGLFRFIDFKISDLKVEADEYGYLFIKARTSGYPNANIVVKCYPTINSLSNSLVLQDLSYSIRSKNILYKVAKPFFKKPVNKFIEHNSNIQYDKNLKEITKVLSEKVNSLNMKYFQPIISNSNISILNIKPMKDYLVIYLSHTGIGMLNIKSDDIRIAVPPSPLKIKNDGSCQ